MRTTLFIAIPFIVLAFACYVAWHLWKIAPHGWKLLPSGLFVLWMATMVASFPSRPPPCCTKSETPG